MFKPIEMLKNKMKNRIDENKYTGRTVTPIKGRPVSSNSCGKKYNYEDNYKLQTQSSIPDLINKTADIEQKYKKYADRLLQSNEIFTPKLDEWKKQKGAPRNQEGVNYGRPVAGGFGKKKNDEVSYYNETNYKNKKNISVSMSMNKSSNKSMDYEDNSATNYIANMKTTVEAKRTIVANQNNDKIQNNTFQQYLRNIKKSQTKGPSINSTNHESYSMNINGKLVK